MKARTSLAQGCSTKAVEPSNHPSSAPLSPMMMEWRGLGPAASTRATSTTADSDSPRMRASTLVTCEANTSVPRGLSVMRADVVCTSTSTPGSALKAPARYSAARRCPSVPSTRRPISSASRVTTGIARASENSVVGASAGRGVGGRSLHSNSSNNSPAASHTPAANRVLRARGISGTVFMGAHHSNASGPPQPRGHRPLNEKERAPGSGILSTLKFRDFRLYWLGLGISNVGDGLQNVAGGWLIARLTDSAAVVGGVTGTVMLPIMALMLVGGVLADRYERRKILLVTQSLLCLLALAGVVVVALGQVSLPMVVLWFLMLGALLAFNAPPEHALIAQLVPPGHLPSALVLRGASFSTSQLVGAGVAAGLLGLGSPPRLVLLGVIRPLPTPLPAPETAGDGSFREGLRYAWEHRPLRALLGANALIAFFIHPFYKVFLPLFVKMVLGGSARELGQVMFGAGVGTFLGSLALAHVAPRARGTALIVTNVFVPLELAALAFTETLWLATLHCGLLGLGISLSYGLTHTLLQVTAPDRFRGRVISFSELMQMGLPSLAAIALGLLVDVLRFPITMCLGAAVFLVPATAWLLSARLSAFTQRLEPGTASLEPSTPNEQTG